MKFIRIKGGLSIAVHEIEAIQRVDDLHTTVYTHHNKYKVAFPYTTLLSILENESVSPLESSKQELFKDLRGVLQRVGHFAG